MIVTFEVPLLPPSVNHYLCQGKTRQGSPIRFRTSEAKAYIEAVCICSGKTPATGGDFYEIGLVYYIERAKFLRVDENNFDKVAIDALQTAGVITDDRYVIGRSTRKRICETMRDQKTIYTVKAISAEEI